jgi:hypothetical protein
MPGWIATAATKKVMERNAGALRSYLYRGAMPEGLTTPSLEWVMTAERDPKVLERELHQMELQLSEDA